MKKIKKLIIISICSFILFFSYCSANYTEKIYKYNTIPEYSQSVSFNSDPNGTGYSIVLDGFSKNTGKDLKETFIIKDGIEKIESGHFYDLKYLENGDYIYLFEDNVSGKRFNVKNGIKQIEENSAYQNKIISEIKKRYGKDDIYHIVFSPDGKGFAFSFNKGVKKSLLVKDWEELEVDGNIQELMYSPLGNSFLYKVEIGDGKGYYIVNNGIKGKVYDEIFEEGFERDYIKYSFDGKKLAHVARKGKEYFIVDNGKEFGPYSYVGLPEYSFDGKHIKYLVDDEFSDDYLICVDGKKIINSNNPDSFIFGKNGGIVKWEKLENLNFLPNTEKKLKDNLDYYENYYNSITGDFISISGKYDLGYEVHIFTNPKISIYHILPKINELSNKVNSYNQKTKDKVLKQISLRLVNYSPGTREYNLLKTLQNFLY